MLKRIFTIVLYILIPAGVLVLLGFAAESNRSMPVKSFQVSFVNDHGNRFVDSASVIRHVYSRLEPLPGQKIRDVSLRKIEKLINELYYVEHSQVYSTIDGAIIARISQREPIARVINSHNESFYIDRNGKLMKTTPRYSARVVVVSGYIPSRYSPTVDLSLAMNDKSSSRSDKTLCELFDLINYIEKDRFLNAWIDQIYITRSGGFELIPKNGSHVVEFGDISDMEQKFNKLIMFYKNGLTNMGWNNYRRINLKFKNQIVCSK
jgi:cell division protein FtsQ